MGNTDLGHFYGSSEARSVQMTEVRILSVRNAEKGNKQFITLEKISDFESEWTRLNSNASALCRSTYHIAHTDYVHSISIYAIHSTQHVTNQHAD